MTPLPGSLGTGEIICWRLDHVRFASSWDSGEGAFKLGGRWNSKGTRAVYAAADPATAILEVAVHKGFAALDTVPHVLTAFEILQPATAHIVRRDDVPSENWLRPGIPSAGQQRFGDDLIAAHPLAFTPSVVSRHSWNIIFDPATAVGFYKLRSQEEFALDTRLHPPR